MSRSASTLSQSQITNWVRWYKSAPEGYKPHALSACLKADGIKMLHAVLKELKLESAADLVQDWDKQG